MNENKKKFKTKSFTSFSISWIFLLLTVSGIIIYFTPNGRIANWTNWTLWGLTKTEWQGLHVIFSCLFIIFMMLHLFFNWKVLSSYLKSKASAGIRLKREFALSTGIAALFIIITLIKWQPVWILMDWREDIKQKGNSMESSFPISNSEDLSVEKISEIILEPIEKTITSYRNNGVSSLDPEKVLKMMSEQSTASAEKIHALINSNGHRPRFGRNPGLNEVQSGEGSIDKSNIAPDDEHTNEKSPEGRGFGYGRKTIAEFCAQNGITVDTGINKLKKNGINAKPGDKIRSLAETHNIRPSEVARFIEK
jgi:hypothetical protein